MPLNESGAWRAGRGTACPRRLASNCVWLGVVIDEEVWRNAGLARRGAKKSCLVQAERGPSPATLGKRAAASAVQEAGRCFSGPGKPQRQSPAVEWGWVDGG